MNKAYSRINFQNAPSTATPLNATNLNKMDKAINDLDDRIIELSGYQEEAQEAAEQASSSASAAAKAAETATADAEARVNTIIEGLEVFTKEDSQKKFASVIKQTVTGSPLLIKDSADAGTIDFKGKGRSTQKQGNFYDGELLQGYYNANGSITSYAGRVSAKNLIPCSEGNEISFKYSETASQLLIAFFKAGAWTSQVAVQNTSVANATVPSGADAFGITINQDGITPTTAKTISVTVNGSTSYPSPDYPQEIKSVADGGYFDGELLQGYYNSSNGTYATNNTSAICSKNTMPCGVGDSIEVSYTDTLSQIRICYYNNGTYSTFGVANNTSKHTFTVPTNATEFHISIIANDTLSPTTAKPITVTINGKYALIVKSRGKNILQNTVTTQTINGVTLAVNNDKSITINGTTDNDINIVIGNVTNLLSGKKYIVSGVSGGSSSTYNVIVQKMLNNNWVANTWLYNGETNYTIDSTYNMLSYRLVISKGVTINTTLYPMVRLADTNNTYEPYKETVSYIPLNEPLRGINSVTDEVNPTKVTRRFAEVVFDGSSDENWMTAGEGNAQRFYLNVRIANPTSHDKVASILCDKFTPNTVNYIILDQSGKENCIGVNGIGNIMVRYKELTTVAEWKAWLQNNPITVVYELAEPVVEAIEPVDIVTYNNVTYLTASDDADMEVTYATDTKSYIDSKFAELHAALVNML